MCRELARLRLSSIDSVEADADLLDALAERRAADAASASVAAGRRRHDPQAHEAPPSARRRDRVLRSGAAAAARRGVRRRHHRRLPDRDRGDVRPLARSGRRMRADASARLSVLAAARHAGGAHAAGRAAASSRSAPGALREKGEAALRRHLDGEVGARRRVLAEARRRRPHRAVHAGAARRARSSPAPSSMSPSPATTGGSCWRRDRLRTRREEKNHGGANGASNSHLITTWTELEALFPDEVYPPARGQGDRPHQRRTTAPSSRRRRSACWRPAGPEGLDCSPRGERRASCAWSDEKTLMVPDRRGNNRIDSLRNIVTRSARRVDVPHSRRRRDHPRDGPRHASRPIRSCARASRCNGKAPRCVLVIAVEQVFFQCAKAIVRSKLWDPARQVERASLPTTGKILRRDQRRQARRRRARPRLAPSARWRRFIEA